MTASLEFIIGRAGTGKTERCLNDAVERIKDRPLGGALILLMPEHMTYKLERELAERLAAQGAGFMRAYVFGFRRFARKILLETGAGHETRISEVGRRLLLRKILTEQGDTLKVFARVAKKRGFTGELSELIKEIKSYKLSSDLLRQAGEGLSREHAHLAGKLEEISLLADAFEEHMKGRATDAEDMMELLAQKIPDAPLLRDAEIWLDGFTFFNPQEREVVRALLETAKAVHITLPLMGVKGAHEIARSESENMLETGLFNRAYKTYKALAELYREMGGGAPAVIHLEKNMRAGTAALGAVETSLFSSRRIAPTASDESVRLIEAANRRLESEAVAGDILRLAREGWRYRDIGVLVRDEDAYGGMLELVFNDYGIPYFYDRKRPGSHHPIAELLRSALEIIRRGWRYDDVFLALRTGFFPCSEDDIDKLENYVLEFGIRGRSQWEREEPWAWRRRRSLEEADELSERELERLLQLDGIRKCVAAPLLKLADSIHEAGSVREKTTALYEFLLELGVPERLLEWEELAKDESLLAGALEHKQIWSSIIELFDQLAEISGEEKMSLEDYEGVLGAGLDALELSLIPPGLDYVTIASFDQNSLENSRALYILGANAGIMPRRAGDKGLLTDADREHLSSVMKKLKGADAEMLPGGRDRSFSERFLLYKGFSEASEYLCISYALADSQGAGLAPASLIYRLADEDELRGKAPAEGGLAKGILSHIDFHSIPLATAARKNPLELLAPRPALSALSLALRDYKDSLKSKDEENIAQEPLAPLWQSVYNWALSKEEYQAALRLAVAGLFASANKNRLGEELAGRLYLNGSFLRGSVTRFERFQKCPFAHFALYGLKLEERREYKFSVMDLGTLLHAVLSRYGSIVKEKFQNNWAEVPEETRSELCAKLIEELSPRVQSEVLLSKDNYRHLKRRLTATAERAISQLSAWAAISRFRPEFLEKSFGGGDVRLKPLELSQGRFLSFTGQIDRLDVDLSGKYYLIIDYKTGQAAINLFEVYYGLRLQLLAYLLVASELLKGEERLPAGMLYAFLKNPLVAAETSALNETELADKVEKELRMPGWVLAEPEVIEAIEAGAGGHYIRSKLTKAGKPSPKDSVKTSEEFEMLLSYVEHILKETGERILAGEIAASPYRLRKKHEMACNYCAFKTVCGFDTDIEGFAPRDLEEYDEKGLEEKMRAAIEEAKSHEQSL